MLALAALLLHPSQHACHDVPQVAVDMAHHKTMLELHRRVSASDVILGWCVQMPIKFVHAVMQLQLIQLALLCHALCPGLLLGWT